MHFQEVREPFGTLDKHFKLSDHNFGDTSKAIDNDVSEVYSFPRVVLRASEHGLRPGFSLDLTGNAPNGEPWHFNCPHMRSRSVQEFNEHQPEMFICSQMCGPCSTIQGWNYSKMDLEVVEAKLQEGVIHFKICLKFCKMQVDRSRLLIFEHPVNAKSLMLSTVKDIMQMFGVMIHDFHFCQFNMTSQVRQEIDEGTVYVRSPSRVFSEFPSRTMPRVH